MPVERVGAGDGGGVRDDASDVEREVDRTASDTPTDGADATAVRDTVDRTAQPARRAQRETDRIAADINRMVDDGRQQAQPTDTTTDTGGRGADTTNGGRTRGRGTVRTFGSARELRQAGGRDVVSPGAGAGAATGTDDTTMRDTDGAVDGAQAPPAGGGPGGPRVAPDAGPAETAGRPGAGQDGPDAGRAGPGPDGRSDGRDSGPPVSRGGPGGPRVGPDADVRDTPAPPDRPEEPGPTERDIRPGAPPSERLPPDTDTDTDGDEFGDGEVGSAQGPGGAERAMLERRFDINLGPQHVNRQGDLTQAGLERVLEAETGVDLNPARDFTPEGQLTTRGRRKVAASRASEAFDVDLDLEDVPIASGGQVRFSDAARAQIGAQQFTEQRGIEFDADDVVVTDAGVRLDDEAQEMLARVQRGQLGGAQATIREDRDLGLGFGGPIFRTTTFEDVMGRGGNRLAAGQQAQPTRTVRMPVTTRATTGTGIIITRDEGITTRDTDAGIGAGRTPGTRETRPEDTEEDIATAVQRGLVRDFPVASLVGATAATAAGDALDGSPRDVASEAIARRFPALTVLAGDIEQDRGVTLSPPELSLPEMAEDGAVFTDRQRARQAGSRREARFLDQLFGGIDDWARDVESDLFAQETGTEEEFLLEQLGGRSPQETAAALAPFAAAEPTPVGEGVVLGLLAAGALAGVNERSDPFTAGEGVEQLDREAPARRPELPVQAPQAREAEVPVEEGEARDSELPVGEPGVDEVGIPDDGVFVETVRPTEPEAPIQVGQQGRQREQRRVRPGDIAQRREVERRRRIGDVQRRRDLEREREERRRLQRRRKREAQRREVEVDEEEITREFPTGEEAVIGRETAFADEAIEQAQQREALVEDEIPLETEFVQQDRLTDLVGDVGVTELERQRELLDQQEILQPEVQIDEQARERAVERQVQRQRQRSQVRERTLVQEQAIPEETSIEQQFTFEFFAEETAFRPGFPTATAVGGRFGKLQFPDQPVSEVEEEPFGDPIDETFRNTIAALDDLLDGARDDRRRDDRDSVGEGLVDGSPEADIFEGLFDDDSMDL